MSFHPFAVLRSLKWWKGYEHTPRFLFIFCHFNMDLVMMRLGLPSYVLYRQVFFGASDFGGKARPRPRARLFRDARIVSSGWKDTLLCLRGHKHPPPDGWESYLQKPSGRTPTNRPRCPGAKLEWNGRREKAFYLCQPMPPCAKGCQLLRIWCRYAGKYFILHVHSPERPLISRYL